MTATIAAEKKASLTESPHFDSKAAKLAGTNLSPLNWLLAAASCAGAVAALVIVLSFDLLNNTSAAVAPLKERIVTLGKLLDYTESAEAALASRIAATESAAQPGSRATKDASRP